MNSQSMLPLKDMSGSRDMQQQESVSMLMANLSTKDHGEVPGLS